MFRAIVNIPLDAPNADEDDILDLLRPLTPDALPEHFSRLSIAYGDHPDLTPENKREGSCFTLNSVTGRFVLAGLQNMASGEAVMSLCPILFEIYYNMGTTLHPPAEIASVPGMGCDGLGDHETDFMASPA
jgi:hypothetical protein